MTHLLTPDDAAERLAVTSKVVRAWLRDGKLKGIRFGRLWRINPAELERFLKSGFTGTGEKAAQGAPVRSQGAVAKHARAKPARTPSRSTRKAKKSTPRGPK